MKKISLFLLSILSLFVMTAEAANGHGSIRWFTNYQEALSNARSSSKPLVLFFTGSDWCTWCIKLEQEALDTPDFAAIAGDKFVFVKLDFPRSSPLPPDLDAQNKDLQRRFNIRGYPTIVVVDPQQERAIGTTGYRQGGGRQFALHLLSLVNSYSGNRPQPQQMSKLDAEVPAVAEVK